VVRGGVKGVGEEECCGWGVGLFGWVSRGVGGVWVEGVEVVG